MFDRVFPHAGIERERFPASRERRQLDPRPAKIPRKGSNPAREISPGELLGIEFHGRWIAGVALGRHVEGKRSVPVVEFFRGSWASEPTPEALASQPVRAVGPFLEAPIWRREPLALDGLELFGPVMPARLKLLGRAAEPPDTLGLVLHQQSYRVIAPQNLLYVLFTLLNPGKAHDG